MECVEEKLIKVVSPIKYVVNNEFKKKWVLENGGQIVPKVKCIVVTKIIPSMIKIAVSYHRGKKEEE